MSFLRTKGIIIKEVNTGEADKIVTIFTKTNGKVSASARGARRPKSPLVAGTQLMCYGEFVLFKGKEMYSINSCEVIEPFYEIRNNIINLTYSAHITDIINDIIQENQPATKVLQLFLNTLHMLAKTNKSPELIARIFELRALSILGYTPYVNGCTICGRTGFENISFSFKDCGFICNDTECLKSDTTAIKILPGTAKAMCYIVYAKMNELFSFNVSNEVLGELEKIMRKYIREQLERDYKKLDFLKTLNM